MTDFHILSKTSFHAEICDNPWMKNKSKNQSFWDRLTEAMKANGIKITQERAGDLAGVHQTAARKWQHGDLPTMKNVVEIAKKTGFSTEWLLTGNGPKRPGEATADDSEIPIMEREELTEEEFELLTDSAEAVLLANRHYGSKLDPRKISEIITAIYEEARATRKPSKRLAKSLVRLALKELKAKD